MNRTSALVAILVVVGSSGCLAGDGGGAPETTTTSTTPTTTRSVEFPSKPTELTTESVKTYVESSELAFRRQAIYDRYDGDSTTVSNIAINPQNLSVEKRGDRAFLVTFQYMVGFNTVEDGTTTAADVRYVAQYYVNASTTLRVATPGISSAGLNPIENGTEVGEHRKAVAQRSP